MAFWTSLWSVPSVAEWLRHQSAVPWVWKVLHWVMSEHSFTIWWQSLWKLKVFWDMVPKGLVDRNSPLEECLWRSNALLVLAFTLCLAYHHVKKQLPSDTATTEAFMLSSAPLPWWDELSQYHQLKVFPSMNYLLWESTIEIRNYTCWFHRSL